MVNTAASSSLFGYTPLNPTRQITVAGTANQITSSAGAQDLSADRTWTLSIPSQFNISQASTTLLSAHQAWFGMTASTTIGTDGKITFPYSSSTIYSSFIHASTTNLTFGGVTGNKWTDFCVSITGAAGLCDGSDDGAGGGLTSYDAWTHPAAGQSATTSLMLFNGQASSTLFSSNYAKFGATASTTIGLDGSVTTNSTTTTQALQVGTTAIGSNVAKFSPLTGLVTSNSESVGGIVNENYGTTDALNHVIYSNNTGSQRVLSIISDAATYSGNTVHIRNDGTATALNISCEPQGQGCLKIAAQGAGDANAALISLDASTGSFLGQTMFMKCGSSATCWNLRDLNNSQILTVNKDGYYGFGTTTPQWQAQIATSSKPQLVLSDPNAGTNLKHWTQRSVGGNFYLATSSDSFATSSLSALTIDRNGFVGVASSSPVRTFSVVGDEWHDGRYFHFGNANSNDGVNGCAGAIPCIELVGDNNSNTGVQFVVENINSGSSAYGGIAFLNNRSGTVTTNYSGIWTNGSGYNDNTFGTGQNFPDLMVIQTTMGGISMFASSTAATPQGTTTINYYIDGARAGAKGSGGDEVGRFDTFGLKIATTTNTLVSNVTIASSTAPQLALSAGAGNAQWAVRNAGGNLYFSTTTVAGTATSTNAVSIQSAVSGSSGLLIGTSTLGSTGMSIVGKSYLWGLTANQGASTYSLCLSSANEITTNTDAETCIASSRRWKENIKTLDLGLSEVMKLKPSSFEYKDGSGKAYGLIAEDVAQIDPLLASYDEEGLPSGIHWSYITALNTKAIQELAQKTGNSARENWQWLCILALGLAVVGQQIQIRKLQK